VLKAAVEKTAAVEKAGLEDFGSTDFHERLSLWLSETDENPERTAMGRFILFNDCVRSAANRLRIRDLLKRHPEIHDVEIVKNSMRFKWKKVRDQFEQILDASAVLADWQAHHGADDRRS
jgi:hypothetical protein